MNIPVLLPQSTIIPFISSIKAGGTIFLENIPLNNYLKIDPKTDFIQMVTQEGAKKQWDTHTPITQAVAGSSIAVVGFFGPNGQYVPRIYYQDPELRLREHWFDHSRAEWVLGKWFFNLCRCAHR